MRYFVICSPDVAGVDPYIAAEVVREIVEEDRSSALASVLAGPRARVVTRAELLTDPAGRRALVAWEGRDDSGFDRESEALRRESPADEDRPSHVLRAVGDDCAPMQRRSVDDRTSSRNHATRRPRALRAAARSIARRPLEKPPREGSARDDTGGRE